MYIIELIFEACCDSIELIAGLFGWTYKEACVYVNLYVQYGVLILSSLSIVYVAVRKMMQGFVARRLVVLIAVILYNVPFVWLGVWLWNRYGVIDSEAAFNLCVNDLWVLGEQLNLPTDLPYYSEGWTEYYVVNIVIFVAIFLFVLLVNWGVKRIIKKRV